MFAVPTSSFPALSSRSSALLSLRFFSRLRPFTPLDPLAFLSRIWNTTFLLVCHPCFRTLVFPFAVGSFVSGPASTPSSLRVPPVFYWFSLLSCLNGEFFTPKFIFFSSLDSFLTCGSPSCVPGPPPCLSQPCLRNVDFSRLVLEASEGGRPRPVFFSPPLPFSFHVGSLLAWRLANAA